MNCIRSAAVILTLASTVTFGVAASHGGKTDDRPKRVKSYRQLAALLQQKQPQYLFDGAGAKGGVLTAAPMTGPGSAGGANTVGAPMAGGGDAQFSVTNVQVGGVDEADIVKNDGRCIYQISRERVLISTAFPDTELALTSVLQFGSDFVPSGLFLDEGLLVVVGTSIRRTPVEPGVLLAPATTKAVIYDVSDPRESKIVREIEIDGSYLSSRKVDHCVYLVARKYPDFYALGMMGPTANIMMTPRASQPAARQRTAGVVPALRDTARSKKPRNMRARDVYYFPGFNEPDYLVVVGFDLSKKRKAASISALLGAGDAVYASREHLYVADTKFLGFFMPGVVAPGMPVGVTSTGNVAPGGTGTSTAASEKPQQTTTMYRFGISGGAVSFEKEGDVPGTVLNQFAMDEYDGHFRVATTVTDYTTWTTVNNLYVLDDDMKVEGKLEGLAPGERIFSTRFIGERCYMVTYRMVDPLFVISTADSSAPVVLGQLKIPGFSNYLHPYDENHILGFGKDAVDGLYQGVKIACFDVSDVSNPVLQSGVSIGDRGTDSEVLWDSKALLFDKDKNLLALPITLAEIKNKTPDMPAWTYGDIVFQGAYVYNFTLEGGFVFRKAITHQSDAQAGQYLWDTVIRRLLYIENDLYSVSDGQIQAHDLETFDQKGALLLPP